MIKGIDISRYQGNNFSFAAAKNAGVKFVIIRAGIGCQVDTYYRHNIAECIKHKLPYGLYWYIKSTSMGDLQSEVEYCIKTIGSNRPVYPIFFDMEERSQIEKLDRTARTEMAIYFCEEIKKAGLYPGIYTNPSWLENYYNKNELIDKYDIWLAHWTHSPDKPTNYDYGQTMWQWGIEKIGGIDADADICYVDYPKIIGAYYAEQGIDIDATTEPEEARLNVGDKVKVKPGATFANGVKPFDFVYHNIYDIMQISGDKALIGQSGDYTGWMYCVDLIPALEVKETSPENTLSVGDTVKVKAGAETYGGRQLAAFVYTQHYTVMQVGTANKPDYIVIGQNGNVTAAIKEEDLIKI